MAAWCRAPTGHSAGRSCSESILTPGQGTFPLCPGAGEALGTEGTCRELELIPIFGQTGFPAPCDWQSVGPPSPASQQGSY